MNEKPALLSHWGSDGSEFPDEPSPLRDPLRLLAVAGAVAIAIGVVMPWIDYGIDAFHASANGFTGDTWGIIELAIAALVFAVAASGSVARSRSRRIQLLPAVTGLVALVIYYDASLAAGQLADSYRASGYSVSFPGGLEVLLLGSLLCALSGVAASAAAWRRTPPAPRSSLGRSPGSDIGPGIDFLAELVLGAVVGVGCAVAGGFLAASLPVEPEARAQVMILAVLAGGFLGMVLLDRLWRRFVSRRSRTGRLGSAPPHR